MENKTDHSGKFRVFQKKDTDPLGSLGFAFHLDYNIRSFKKIQKFFNA